MSGLKLHLGCGSTVVPGWENVDKSWNVHLARVPGSRRLLARARILTDEQAHATFPPGIVRADIRRGLRYPDGSASHVYSSHVIEHMARWQALELMRECRRVLQPGGVIRLATPDLGRIIEDYVRREGDANAADDLMHQLGTHCDAPGSIAQRLIRRLVFAPHQWLYDEHSLPALLVEAGFSDPVTCTFRTGRIPDLERLEHREGSLFVEAIRA